jgi:Abhydrolase family
MNFRDLIQKLGEERPPALRYEGDGSAEDFLAWQESFRAKLTALRGEPLELPPLAVAELAQVDCGDHVRHQVMIDSVLGSKIPAYVLVPKGLSGPAPAILALHGHFDEAKERVAGVLPDLGDGDQAGDYGLHMVRAGYVVLCFDWWGWNERAEEGYIFGGREMCNVKHNASVFYGVPLLSICLSDARRALDALVARPEVDANRVGVMGNSFGGRMSMYVSVFDSRIRAAVCAGCLSCFRERTLALRTCAAQFFPGLLQWGDVPEIFSLIAPRPVMIMTGSDDGGIHPDWAAKMKPIIRNAYHALDADENLLFHDFDGGHLLPTPPTQAWFDKHLA